MAGLRLLGVAALIVASVAIATRCTREVDVPRIAGVLLDERTGNPIGGAALYLSFSGSNPLNAGGHGSAAVGNIDERIAMTSPDGRFEIPAHSFRLSWFVRLDSRPGFWIVHREYGSHVEFLSDDRATWDSVQWRVSPRHDQVAKIGSGASACEDPCSGLGRTTYRHCYEMLCGEPLPNFRRLPEDRE